MSLTKFETAIPAGEWLQTHASDGANTGVGAIVRVTEVFIEQELSEH